MTITNILLMALVIGIAIFVVYYYIKKKKEEKVEETINVDDKTYTLDKMKEFVKKRLDEITKVNLYDIGLSEEELKRRLLEYQKYKESTSTFRTLEDKRSNYYTKVPEKRELYTTEKLENNEGVSANDLLVALQKLLERKEYSKPLNTKIAKKELSVSDRVNKIRSILKKQKIVEFLSLFEELSRPYIVVTFLGILEMAKDKEIVLKQDKNFGTILLERVD